MEKSEALLWLKDAKRDLRTARANLRIKIYYASSFFSHLAAEKALKALYLKKFGRVEKTHDLVFLAENVGAKSELYEACDKLNPANITTRYLSATQNNYKKVLSAEDAKNNIKEAERVIRWVQKNI